MTVLIERGFKPLFSLLGKREVSLLTETLLMLVLLLKFLLPIK